MVLMSNPVYQAAIEELEAVLSPRVVSRSVKEGLNQIGRTPDTVSLNDFEQILKAQVYRQLQLTMPVTKAKETVADMLDRLREVSEQSATGDASEGGLEAQGEELGELAEAMRPFNLYFEWSEVQKLRAQIQLLSTEHEEGREAPSLMQDAKEQLDIVRQKLEDELVMQAQDLADLTEALTEVRTRGGVKVRRLETLVNQVARAQEHRQLAPAESDRAQAIARNLRIELEESADKEKEPASAPDPLEASGLVSPQEQSTPEGATVRAPESETESPLSGEAAGETEAEAAHHGSEGAAERIRLLDLDGEQRQLRQLESEFANLLSHQPGLARRFEELRFELEASRSVAAILVDFRTDLDASKLALRADLQEEFEEIITQLPSLRREVDTSELEQAVQVTLGILSTTLPSHSDVDHVRRLAQIAREVDAELAESEEAVNKQLVEQERLIERLQATLLKEEAAAEGFQADPDLALIRHELEQLRDAQERRTTAPELMTSMRQAEERLARNLAERATDRSEVRRARLFALRAQLESLPVIKSLASEHEGVRLEIERLLSEQETNEAVGALLIDERPKGIDPDVVEADIDALTEQLAAFRSRAIEELRNRLEELREEAVSLGSRALSDRLDDAAAALEGGSYPDLDKLARGVKQEQEAERLLQIDELRRLTQLAGQFAGDDSEAASQVRQWLKEADAALDGGSLALNLPQAADAIEQLKANADERLATVPRRLSRALQDLQRVEALNNEDVVAVRRILIHLDSQKESLGRLSPGLRLQLEASLTNAEGILEKLHGEFEATRRVADQLVSGGVLDGVFGLFRTGSSEDEGGVPLASEADPTFSTAPSVHLQEFSEHPNVTAAAVLDAAGELVSGRTTRQGSLPKLRSAATQMMRLAGAPEPNSAEARIVTVELSSGSLLVGWLPNGDALLVELDDAAAGTALVGRLRRKIRELSEGS